MKPTLDAVKSIRDSFLRVYLFVENKGSYLAGTTISKVGMLDAMAPEDEKDDLCIVVNLCKGYPLGDILPSHYQGVKVFYRTTRGKAVEYEKRKLRRMQGIDAWLGGVCAGIAYWMGIPVWITRLVWFLVVFFFWPVGLPLYILLWVFLPKWEDNPRDLKTVTGD